MKRLILIFIIYFTTNHSLFATPEFAREHQASCSVCHSEIPMLNATGESFVRNGFRFSSSDETTLQKTLKGKTIPIAVMLRESYSSYTEDDSQKVKLYAGGSLSKSLSFFAVTQKVYNQNDSQNAPDFFEQKASRAYLQLNIQDDKHVFRAGLMSPFTQFGNTQKLFANSALQGINPNKANQNNSNNTNHNNQNGKGKYGKNTRALYTNNNIQKRGNQNYKTPLQQAAFSKFKGAEYSYLFNSKLLFMISYGKPVEEDPNPRSNSHQNHQNTNFDDSDDYQVVSGVRYSFDNGLKIGLMYNNFKKRGDESYSFILPIEKSFDKLTIGCNLVYKNNDNTNDYKGIENALVYSIDENTFIRAIINADEDENDNNNYGYSFGFSKLFKSRFWLNITAAKVDSTFIDDEYIQASISLFL